MTGDLQRFMEMVEAEAAPSGTGAYAMTYELDAIVQEFWHVADIGQASPATARVYCPRIAALAFLILKESGGLEP